LTTQQDVWSETSKLLINFWGADLGCFGERDSNGEIVIRHWTFSAELSKWTDIATEAHESIADVLDSGFLTWRFMSSSPEPLAAAFLPVTQENQVTRVLVVGRLKSGLLSKDLLNIYLALAGLVGTTAERLASEAELRKHRHHLEELVGERTVQLTKTNKQLQNEIIQRQRAEEELQKAHNDLGFRVRERTAELENAREAAAAERQRLYDILETMPVMVCLLTPDYHVAFTNRSFREKYGEDNGRHCFEYRFGLKEPCEFCESLEVLQTGKPHQWESPGPDGSIIDVHDFPFIDTNGSPLILEMGIDITARRRAEVALRAASIYNRRLIEASLDPLVTISAAGKITDANTATERVTGHSREELIGTDFADYFTDPNKARSGYEQVFREGSVKNYELAIRHKDESLTPVIYNASLYSDEHGKVVGVFAAARDISDRKKAEEALRSSEERHRAELEQRIRERTSELGIANERLKNEIAERKQTASELERSNAELQQFAYVASHDLQEPLRMISSYMQLLQRRYEDKLDQDADDFIGFAVDGAKRMRVLINDLLQYSRVGTHGEPFQSVDCEILLNQALANLQISFKDCDAKLTRGPLPTVIADGQQLVQLFQNLIGNALKFRRNVEPLIHVSAKRNDNDWLFSVRDNGTGIEPQYAERIFVIFQRLHGRDEYPGTGIGLSICKKIVERHGGSIWVESEPGIGSTFYFTIPEDVTQTR
jgi:PAS domain S-box-containing protein